MADESGDVEMGYVDDDIEVDDIDVDEELESLNTTKGGVSNSRIPNVNNVTMPGYKTGHTGGAAPAAGDLYLRAANRRAREVVLAKFLPPDRPQFVGVNKVRLYRHGEGTLKGREYGLKKHRDQMAYYNSYVGKRRTMQKHSIGAQNVPDRCKKSWTLEVTPANTEFTEPPRMDPENNNKDEIKQFAEGVEAYNSTYEGGSASAKYALLVMNADGRHVDVVPVGDQAWFRFRSIRGTFKTSNSNATTSMMLAEAAAKEEEVSKPERVMKRGNIKGGRRFERLRERSASAAERREGFAGGYNSKTEERLNVAPVGLRRKINTKVEQEKLNEKGDMEFEAEFDNDDVDQIDRDDKPKVDPAAEARKQRTAQQVRRENAARLRLIKDESLQSNASNNSNSDVDNENSNSNSNSNDSADIDESDAESSLAAAIAKAKKKNNNNTAANNNNQETRKNSNTRRRGEVTKEMLPIGDNLIEETHVRAVILAITTERNKVKAPLKELASHFNELRKKSEQQQKALMKAVKAIGELSKVTENGKPVYYVALKR